MSRGQIEEAEEIIRDAAKKNKVKAPSVIFTALQVRTAAEPLHFTPLVFSDKDCLMRTLDVNTQKTQKTKEPAGQQLSELNGIKVS